MAAGTKIYRDGEGRMSLNVEQVLVSPDVSDIQLVKGVDEKNEQLAFKTQGDKEAYAAAVKARNAISLSFLNGGDAFELVLRVNGGDYQTLASGTVETAEGTQGALQVHAQLLRNAAAPKEAEPAKEE